MTLAVSGLDFGYGKTPILSGIDMKISPGEIIGLIGPNGAGKSTLLKCLSGILRSRRGSVAIDGRKIETFSRQDLARRVAYVPQQSGSGMGLKAVDMIAIGRAPHRHVSTALEDRAAVWDAIERLGLASLAFRPFAELSGGQRQRVLIARALAQRGGLMLMDEPTSNLDPYHQVETITIVREIARERNVAVLVALHDLSLAARMSDALVLMHAGRIHASGAWRDVLRPETLEATFGISALIGSERGLPYVIPYKRAAADF